MRAHSYDEFFAEPITRGRWWWIEPGVSLLLQWGGRRGEHIRLYMRRAPDNWAEPGDTPVWDGDLDAPTLSPSILVRDSDGAEVWHGFFERGRLVG